MNSSSQGFGRCLALAAASLVAGCASVAVTDDAIVANTSRTFGLERSAFTVSDRADSGTQTTYLARTKGGKTYSCYVEGSVSVMGRVVSDAICNEMRKTDKGDAAPRAATPAPSDPNCNALLRAANKCK